MEKTNWEHFIKDDFGAWRNMNCLSFSGAQPLPLVQPSPPFVSPLSPDQER
jgi:hypothetical protein